MSNDDSAPTTGPDVEEVVDVSEPEHGEPKAWPPVGLETKEHRRGVNRLGRVEGK